MHVHLMHTLRVRILRDYPTDWRDGVSNLLHVVHCRQIIYYYVVFLMPSRKGSAMINQSINQSINRSVQHCGSAVYILLYVLHSLLYPTMTSSCLQALPFHSPVYNTLQQVCRYNLSQLTPCEQCETPCSNPNPNPYPLPNHYLIQIVHPQILQHIMWLDLLGHTNLIFCFSDK